MTTEGAGQPRHVAIIGGGPIGLDAALALSESGFTFTLYEAAPQVGAHMRRWGHVRFFSPWRYNLSPRMKAVLNGTAASDDSLHPTGKEYVETVLAPVARRLAEQSADAIRLGCRIVGVSRAGLLKSDEIGTGRRNRARFRLLLEDEEGRERVDYADVVLDCSGTYGHPNALGDGGIPAPGERALASQIEHDIPDPAHRDEWAGRRILLVGGGHSAQAAVRDLVDFAASAPGTEIVWALRERKPHFEVFENDPLPERSNLARFANELVSDPPDTVSVRGGVVVDALAGAGDRITVTLKGRHGERVDEVFDRVLALTGYVGDAGLYRQLQVHECYATSGPMNLSAALLGETSADCLVQEAHGIETLMSPEPDFFLLGAKSYGRNNTFLLKVGFDQVDQVVEHLADSQSS